jgi:hypothetical protein
MLLKIGFALLFLVVLLSAFKIDLTPRVRLVEKVYLIFLFLLGTSLAFFDHTLKYLAHYIGVASAPNLLLYVSILFFLWIVIRTHIRINALQRQVYYLTSQIAILEINTRA